MFFMHEMRWKCIFFLLSINVIYYIDWFLYVDTSLNSWDKSLLVLTYNPLNMMLDSVCYYFVEDLCIWGYKVYLSIVLFSCDVYIWLWYDSTADLLEAVRKCSLLSCSTWTVIIKYHRLGGLNNINLFSHSSGGWKSKFGMSE